MKILPKPLPNIKVEDIYTECVKGFASDVKRTKLLACKGLVIEDSKLYDSCMPHSLNDFLVSELPNDVSKEDLTSVYTQKFADKNGPGRKYYDAIKGQAARGVCPICGVRIVNTLDHYLPKTKVPTLSVTPTNLIPSCRDCNMDKRADMTFDPKDTPVHLYFDSIPNEPWLFTKIDENLEVTYFVDCPQTWDEGLRSRIAKHLDYYKLHGLYSSHASQEIADKLGRWEEIVVLGGIEQLQDCIESECRSVERSDTNSWKAALYRGLKSDFNSIKAYFLNQGIDIKD